MHEKLWGACTLRSLGQLSDEQKTLERAVPVNAAQAALRGARDRLRGSHKDKPEEVDAEARRRLFWHAAVLHSATSHKIAPSDMACWEMNLTNIDCLIASLEVTLKRLLEDMPERGLGLLLCMLMVVRETSSSLVSRSVVAIGMLLPVTSWHLVVHTDPVQASELLSIGLQLVAFEFGCIAVLGAMWLAQQ